MTVCHAGARRKLFVNGLMWIFLVSAQFRLIFLHSTPLNRIQETCLFNLVDVNLHNIVDRLHDDMGFRTRTFACSLLTVNVSSTVLRSWNVVFSCYDSTRRPSINHAKSHLSTWKRLIARRMLNLEETFRQLEKIRRTFRPIRLSRRFIVSSIHEATFNLFLSTLTHAEWFISS